jgi:hypothetical protein
MTFDAQEDRHRFEDHFPLSETEAEIQGLVNVLTDKKILADAFADFIAHDQEGLDALAVILVASWPQSTNFATSTLTRPIRSK